MTVVDRRNLWVRFVSWVDRHRASSVFEYTLGVERMVLSLARQHLALERKVADLQCRLDELDPKGGAA